jgi:hypothetical protein
VKIPEQTFEEISEYFDNEVYFFKTAMDREEAKRIERELRECIASAVGWSGSIYKGEVPERLLYKVREYLIRAADGDGDRVPGQRRAEDLLKILDKTEQRQAGITIS